jgi:hypothetical protein
MYKGAPREPNLIYNLSEIPTTAHWAIITPWYVGEYDEQRMCWSYYAYPDETAWRVAMQKMAADDKKFKAMRVDPVEVKIRTVVTVEVI